LEGSGKSKREAPRTERGGERLHQTQVLDGKERIGGVKKNENTLAAALKTGGGGGLKSKLGRILEAVS